MEIRISLDRVEPPAGHLRLVCSAGPPRPAGARRARRSPFTGWLGLLRALYEVVGPPGGRPLGGG
jgi:hypothetical protein